MFVSVCMFNLLLQCVCVCMFVSVCMLNLLLQCVCSYMYVYVRAYVPMCLCALIFFSSFFPLPLPLPLPFLLLMCILCVFFSSLFSSLLWHQGKESMHEVTHVVTAVDDARLALNRTFKFMLAVCTGKVTKRKRTKERREERERERESEREREKGYERL